MTDRQTNRQTDRQTDKVHVEITRKGLTHACPNKSAFVCFQKTVSTWITRQFPPWSRNGTEITLLHCHLLCVTLAQWVLPCEW